MEDHLDGIEASIADDVVLMASELATNAVRHGRTAFELTLVLEPSEGSILVEVRDHGLGDAQRRVTGAYDGTGRGLQIVDQLADNWGSRVSDEGVGKTVWFVVLVPPFTTASRRAQTGGRRTPIGRDVGQPSGSVR